MLKVNGGEKVVHREVPILRISRIKKAGKRTRGLRHNHEEDPVASASSTACGFRSTILHMESRVAEEFGEFQRS